MDKLSIVTDSNNNLDCLRLENDSIINGDVSVGEGIDFRPIHCTELREKLRSRGWNTEGFKFYFEESITDPVTGKIETERTYKYKLELAENYSISENYIDDGLPIINPSTEKSKSPDIMITKSDIESISSTVDNLYNDIFGDQKGKRELKINRSSKNRIDIVDNVITIIALDSEKSSTYTNTFDLTDLLNHSNIKNLSSKVDVTYFYSIDNNIYGGDITFNSFEINENNELVKNNLIFDKNHVIIEYINGVIKIYPNNKNVSECVLNDIVITYGNIKK